MELELNGLLSCFVTQKHGFVGERDECSIMLDECSLITKHGRSRRKRGQRSVKKFSKKTSELWSEEFAKIDFEEIHTSSVQRDAECDRRWRRAFGSGRMN
jgi:hypothetical protein